MASENPIGATDALVGKRTEWLGHEICLTNAALIAVSALGMDGATLDGNPLFGWALVWGSSRPAYEVMNLVRSPRFGISVISEFAADHDLAGWRETASAARELLGAFNSSVCRFSPRGETLPSAGLGKWISLAAFFAREYGVGFDEFCAMPATRANAYVAAACEREGMIPEDTFGRREDLLFATDFLKKANFDWANKNG